MSDEIVIITPEIEPGSGGLADYTLRVVREWGDRVPVRFIIPRKSDANALRAQLPAHGGKVLVQYSAYGFDHLGYPRRLLHTLGEWKQSSGGLLVIMFHEIWAFWPVLNKNYLVQQLHRRDLRHLMQRADAVFTSTAGQAEQLRALAPDRPVDLLPVGSNITPVAALTNLRTPGVAVLFGLQGSRMHVLSKMQDLLKALAASGSLRKIVTIGGGGTADGDREERSALQAMDLADGFQQLSGLREDEVSQQLATASFALSAQDELSVTKSGTFMAYAAHRLNILSPFASRSADEPLRWATHPEELVAGISDQELETRAAKLHDWQERTCAWPRIAERFEQALKFDLSSAAMTHQ